MSKRKVKGLNLTPEPSEPAATSFELDGWKCENLSGYGAGCVGYPEARAISKDGVQVCLTNDELKMQGFPPAVVQWLLTGTRA